jgi:hypothetical protein
MNENVTKRCFANILRIASLLGYNESDTISKEMNF